MPLSVMRDLGLQVTSPYGNTFGLDSKEVQVHGLIKDLKVQLNAYHDISVLMDVVVLDIPPTYGMFLSRKISACLGGNLVKIYRDPYFTHHVNRASISNYSLYNSYPNSICMVSHASDSSNSSIDLNDLGGDEWYFNVYRNIPKLPPFVPSGEGTSRNPPPEPMEEYTQSLPNEEVNHEPQSLVIDPSLKSRLELALFLYNVDNLKKSYILLNFL